MPIRYNNVRNEITAMKIKHLIVATILAFGVTAGGAFAESATTTPAAPAAPAKPAAPAAKPDADADPDKSAISAKCSAEATKQGLHGKARKVFRSKCKRGKT